MVNLPTNINEYVEPTFEDYFELLKPKVMRLVVFTAAIGLLAAPYSVHPVIALASLLCIAVGAGGAGAFNMWWDADIDSIMKRTCDRPIPSGRVTSQQTLILGIILSVFSIVFLGLFANVVAAGLLAFTIFFYLVIYSIWLKRRTPQNIVIGGAAGAFPPMIGWAIASGGMSFESTLMFLLIFIWTPPHFWTLALFMNQDYSRARVPMLTVTHGLMATRRHIFFYTILLSIVAVSVGISSLGGSIYLLVAVPLNIWFLVGSFRILLRNDKKAKADSFSVERKVFVFSIFYLFIHFGLIGVEAFLERAFLAV